MPRITNLLGLPQPLVDAVMNDEYSRGQSDISVTQLISPPRLVALLRAHDEELEEDASDRLFSLFGQAIHTILERAGTTGIAEERLYADIGGWRISGQVDRMFEGTISDYKTAGVSEMTYGVKPDREKQLNVYAHLARLNGYTVERIEAIFILRDWSKVRAAKDPSYPQKQVAIVELPLWSHDAAQAYIEQRVHLHQQALVRYEGALQNPGIYPTAQAALPLCTDYATAGKENEMWQRPDQWAVHKNGNKRATKLCDWEAEAAIYAKELREKNPKDTYTVQHRPGEPLRCAFYCGAAALCEQAKSMQPTEAEAEPFE